MIENNDERLGKNLRTDAEAGDKIRYYSAFTDLEEARFILDETKALEREGWDLDEIAVLYRSNAQSRVIEQSLFRSGIPYKIYGGLRFYERQEIKHALAYLRLAVNPDDDNALLRVINFPPRGIGARTVENLQTASNEQGITLWQAACNAGAKAAKIAAFVRLIEALRNQVGQLPLSEIIVGILKDSGLTEHYRTQKGDNQDRLDNLDELVNAAIEFKPEDSNFEILPENISDDPAFPILAFLSNAALESGENQAGAGEKAVQLMTVHAAKGLEFNAVFLTGMEEGRFPSEMSLAERGGLEEERRLMYVAITRARKRLYITMAQQRMLHGQTQFGIVSRFVEEIPPEVLHYLSIKKTAYDSYGNTRQTATFKDKIIDDYKQPQTYAGFRIGQNVRHAKFGTGVIIDAADKGESARLTINFGKQGVKELDTKFAKLEEM